ncbi:RING-H2 finger protein ATL64-like [Andrographis paniculata]|uniref:RING-H2 finger protein ATL64-like n=1 Tax=Andrographis paniculata TaxID=175694 RepID=UPI0021E93436|nr:RING-H2 finger protein ATL64-like [Andrographis paniculata]
MGSNAAGNGFDENRFRDVLHAHAELLYRDLSRRARTRAIEMSSVESIHGLSEEAINTCLKIRNVSRGVVVGDEELLICSVCRERLYLWEEEDKTKTTTEIAELGCGHDFHVDCIKQWLRRNNRCPLCRAIFCC